MITLGDVEILRVPEVTQRLPIAAFGVDAAFLEAHKAWLAPRFLDLADLKEYRRGLLLVVMPPADLETLKPVLAALGPDTWLGACMLYTGEDRRRLRDLMAVSRTARVPLIAVNDTLYHHPENRDLQDVVTHLTANAGHATTTRSGFHH